MHTGRYTSSRDRTISIADSTIRVFREERSASLSWLTLRRSFHQTFPTCVRCIENGEEYDSISFSATRFSTSRFFVTESVIKPSIISQRSLAVKDTVMASRSNISTINLEMFSRSSKAKNSVHNVNFSDLFGGERMFSIKAGQSPSIQLLFVVSK